MLATQVHQLVLLRVILTVSEKVGVLVNGSLIVSETDVDAEVDTVLDLVDTRVCEVHLSDWLA